MTVKSLYSQLPSLTLGIKKTVWWTSWQGSLPVVLLKKALDWAPTPISEWQIKGRKLLSELNKALSRDMRVNMWKTFLAGFRKSLGKLRAEMTHVLR